MRPRRVSEKVQPDLLSVLLIMVALPVRLMHRLVFAPLDHLLDRRRSIAFDRELHDCFETLLSVHGGKVVVEQGIRAFDYQVAHLLFPDREIVVTRGREELRVQVNGVEVYVSYEKGYTEALWQSAKRLRRHWDELTDASVSDAVRWAEQEDAL